MDKNEFRKNAKFRRAELFSSEIKKIEADSNIFNYFLKFDKLRDLNTFLIYVSTENEVGTKLLIKYLLSENKVVAVPVCKNKGIMHFIKINSIEDLTESFYGIPEPVLDEDKMITEFKNAVCIVPGVSFDRTGKRIGYGGGYYDRFLEKADNILTIGLCYESMLCDFVPSEPHDKSVDYIITEKGIIKIHG